MLAETHARFVFGDAPRYLLLLTRHVLTRPPRNVQLTRFGRVASTTRGPLTRYDASLALNDVDSDDTHRFIESGLRRPYVRLGGGILHTIE